MADPEYTPSSISDSVFQCLQSFAALLALKEQKNGAHEVDIRQLENEHTRFKLWSENTGAHRKGRSSLEYRLRDSSHLRNQVTKLLMSLQESLSDGKITRMPPLLSDDRAMANAF